MEIYVAGFGLFAALYALFLYAARRQRIRWLQHMHANARPAVATVTGWNWDRGEDDDDLHLAVVRFTTDDGREFDDVEVTSIREERPGPIGGRVDIFYDPDEPTQVLTKRP